MKKIIFLLASLAVSAGLFAQTADDALTLTEEYYEGTARSMAMGGAFTALGGDLGALSINPASSGVFRCSQFTFTPELSTSRSTANYLGNTQSTRYTGLNVSNVGVVLTFDTDKYSGLVNFNFGFVYNKQNNYRSSMKVYGSTDNSSMLSSIAAGLEGIDKSELEKSTFTSGIPWPSQLAWNAYVLAPLSVLGGKYADVNDAYIASTENYNAETDELRIGGMLNQRFTRKTYGSNRDFSINFGGNFSDFLYFGANLNMLSVNRTTEEYYEEKAQNDKSFDDGFVSMDNSYWLRTTGSGLNLKFGVIVAPIAGLRLGATITTPTWYKLNDEWDYTMNTAFNNGHTYTEYSPTGTYEYRITAPMRWSLGAAYTFLDRGLVSFDYESVNNGDLMLKELNGNTSRMFQEENNIIESTFLRSHILRAGCEIRLNDMFSLRGGYQYYSPTVKNTDGVRVYSAGLGFCPTPALSIDLGWNRSSTQTENFQLYDDYDVAAPQGVNRYGINRVVCTFGLKF